MIRMFHQNSQNLSLIDFLCVLCELCGKYFFLGAFAALREKLLTADIATPVG